MSDEDGIFNIVSADIEGERSFYAFMNDNLKGTPQARYLCDDSEIRAWDKTVEEFGGDKANEMIIHHDIESFTKCVDNFKRNYPEYCI